MNQKQAARLLVTLAHTEPDYDALSAEYGAAASDLRGQLPPDFPEQALNLFRENPDTAARLERYEENLSHMQSFGAADILTPELIVAALVLLSVHFHIRRDKKGKWTFEAGYTPLNAQALKPVLSVVAAVIGEFGEGLVELSKKLPGQSDAGQDT